MSLRMLALAVVTVVAVAAPPAAPASATDGASSATAAKQARDVEGGLLGRVANERAQRDLEPLRRSEDLTAVARAHSAAMARSGRLEHNADLGTDVSAWRWIGENIAVGTSAKQIHRMLMLSAPHRANLLRPDAAHVGIGVVRAEGQVWVTQVVRTPAR